MFGGEYPPAFWMPVFPKHIWEPYEDDLFACDNDPAKAEGLLDSAGYKNTDGNGIRNDPKSGDEKVVLEIVIDTTDIDTFYELCYTPRMTSSISPGKSSTSAPTMTGSGTTSTAMMPGVRVGMPHTTTVPSLTN